VTELAELVLELVESESVTERHPLPVDDPTRCRPDITAASERLGWGPEVSTIEGPSMPKPHRRQIR
jgi:dTDP-glucose 4,6-dehydratase